MKLKQKAEWLTYYLPTVCIL